MCARQLPSLRYCSWLRQIPSWKRLTTSMRNEIKELKFFLSFRMNEVATRRSVGVFRSWRPAKKVNTRMLLWNMNAWVLAVHIQAIKAIFFPRLAAIIAGKRFKATFRWMRLVLDNWRFHADKIHQTWRSSDRFDYYFIEHQERRHWRDIRNVRVDSR